MKGPGFDSREFRFFVVPMSYMVVGYVHKRSEQKPAICQFYALNDMSTLPTHLDMVVGPSFLLL